MLSQGLLAFSKVPWLFLSDPLCLGIHYLLVAVLTPDLSIMIANLAICSWCFAITYKTTVHTLCKAPSCFKGLRAKEHLSPQLLFMGSGFAELSLVLAAGTACFVPRVGPPGPRLVLHHKSRMRVAIASRDRMLSSLRSRARRASLTRLKLPGGLSSLDRSQHMARGTRRPRSRQSEPYMRDRCMDLPRSIRTVLMAAFCDSRLYRT